MRASLLTASIAPTILVYTHRVQNIGAGTEGGLNWIANPLAPSTKRLI